MKILAITCGFMAGLPALFLSLTGCGDTSSPECKVDTDCPGSLVCRQGECVQKPAEEPGPTDDGGVPGDDGIVQDDGRDGPAGDGSDPGSGSDPGGDGDPFCQSVPPEAWDFDGQLGGHISPVDGAKPYNTLSCELRVQYYFIDLPDSVDTLRIWWSGWNVDTSYALADIFPDPTGPVVDVIHVPTCTV